MNSNATPHPGLGLIMGVLGICALLTAAESVAQDAVAQNAKDVEGSRDHPMISRVEGATIVTFQENAFDEYALVTGKINGYSDPAGGMDNIVRDLEDALDESNSVHLEGKVTRLTYRIPPNRSTLEVLRSYQNELTAAGFESLYECTDQDCVGPRPTGGHAPHVWLGALARLLMDRASLRMTGSYYDDQRYLAARLQRPDGDVYVSLLALGLDEPIARLDIIEVQPMESGLVSVNAQAMSQEISARGSIALYGIYFDSGDARVKPESTPQLDEVAKLLGEDTELRLLVVGHTDNQGTFAYNMDLSRRRAESVVEALAADYGINRSRLMPVGVSFASPVATNTTDDGRAKNRRVQLVAQ